MLSSSKGTSEQQGKKVVRKFGLNRPTLDQDWGESRRQLAHRVVWHGGMLLAVPLRHTSQTCPACGNVSIVATKITPMWLARLMFYREDIAS
jgi:putative transposase